METGPEPHAHCYRHPSTLGEDRAYLMPILENQGGAI
jgi:hypothetical protein